MRKIFPKIINVELTTYCPYRCPQCYKSNTIVKKNEIDFALYKKIIDDAMQMGAKKVLLSGGEPITHSKLFEIIEYTNKQGLATFLSTSGYGINDSIIQQLKESGLVSLYVSLNGSTESINALSRDGFCDAIRALRLSAKYGLETRINWVARKDNYKDFAGLITMAEELHVKQIDILKYKSTNPLVYWKHCLAKPEIQEVIRIVNNYEGNVRIAIESCYYELKNTGGVISGSRLLCGCSAGKYSIAVDSYGRYSPCTHAEEKYFEEHNKYKSLSDYWQNSRILKRIQENSIDNGCATCEYRKTCHPCKVLPFFDCSLMAYEDVNE